MSSPRTLLALVLALTLGASSAWSASITIGASKDNSIFQDLAANSAGGAAGIFVGTTVTGSPRRGLIAFDVAGSVPAGATITSAQLTLNLALSRGASKQTVGLHRLLADWGEGTAGNSNLTVQNSGGGFAAGAGDATWNQRYFGSTAWSNPGAIGDFDPSASSSAAIESAGVNPTPYDWLSTPELVGDVQSWLDNPVASFGWILINANETPSGSARAFFSRSATVNAGGDPLDPSARPALTITYSIVPEPSTVVLSLLSGAVVFVVRRR